MGMVWKWCGNGVEGCGMGVGMVGNETKLKRELKRKLKRELKREIKREFKRELCRAQEKEVKRKY